MLDAAEAQQRSQTDAGTPATCLLHQQASMHPTNSEHINKRAAPLWLLIPTNNECSETGLPIQMSWTGALWHLTNHLPCGEGRRGCNAQRRQYIAEVLQVGCQLLSALRPEHTDPSQLVHQKVCCPNCYLDGQAGGTV